MKFVGQRHVHMWVGAVVLLAACGSASNSAPRAPSSHTRTAGKPYSLYTHCGVHEAHLGHTYYVAEHPLDDGQGNPPPGWGNPYQPGSITTPSPGVAVFRDTLGHVVRFHARPGATAFLGRTCS